MTAPVGTTWVFGYGSLVAPMSIGRTLGRRVDRATGFAGAWLDGFGRRWNYGSMHQRGDWHGPHGRVEQGVVVCLGLAAATGERCNGAVVAVTDAELALLDWRERDYERVDVSDQVAVETDRFDGRVVTYVPRASAVDRYESARDRGRAAVRRSYVDLVDAAFAALGPDHHGAWARTPPPDVPVLDFP